MRAFFGGGVGEIDFGGPFPFLCFPLGADSARTRAKLTILLTSALGGIDWVKAASKAFAVPTVRLTEIESESWSGPVAPVFFVPMIVSSAMKNLARAVRYLT
jgi:hypothetical protein